MPDPKVQAYLAQHYLSGPKADAILARHQQQEAESEEQRKRKRRKKRSSIQDEGSGTPGGGRCSSGSGSGSKYQGLKLRDETDDWKRIDEEIGDADAQVVPEVKRVKFKKGGWAALDPDGRPTSAIRTDAENAAEEEEEEGPQLAGPDGINLDATAAELAQAQKEEEDARRGREAERSLTGLSQPLSGLRTKEQVRADRLAREEAQRQEELHRLAAGTDGEEDTEAQREARLAQTTVYRDERGRRIDVEAEDEILRKEEDRRKRKERERKDWNRGEIQREEEKKRQRELERVKTEGVARSAADERMNAELKAIERADDPALAFLTKKRPKGPQLPKYKGPPPPPNRFGVQPGYRWDGVDRGNGFEKKLFEARGARVRREQDERAYGTSDM